jgi:hypothetical protein
LEFGAHSFSYVFRALPPGSDLKVAFKERRWEQSHPGCSGGWISQEWSTMFREQLQRGVSEDVRLFDLIPLRRIGMLEAEESILSAIAERDSPLGSSS